ncbi:hypothetical protein [Oligosphaera ethanolica]|uniref:HEAT repeat domain-containing protein n=1 Tax=Oligosphaera ethanolica TaxID=760260 RepID=A0AAE3VDW2_9BACT|nr:hypothetical protein [Oligosphaera ethanolica]MDQ0288441.1 hypothetical protein [Oligosphaera ethanolica]
MHASKRVTFLLLATMALVLVFMAWRTRMNNSRHTPGTATNANKPLTAAQPEESSAAAPQTTAASGGLFSGDELVVQELQDLLDDEDKHDEALQKALAMCNGSAVQQLAAIDAFRWLGGRKAMKSLIGLRNNAYLAVADEAGRVLTHLLTESNNQGGNRHDSDIPDDGLVILDEGVYEEDPLGDEQHADLETWILALTEAPSPEAREELLLILSTYAVDQSVPILLELFDNPNEALREAVRQILTSITGQEEILDREQVVNWFAAIKTNHDDANDQQ